MRKINRYTTDQRRALTEFFKKNVHESFSVKQLENLLGADGISKSAIYRNIAVMEQEGLLCRVSSGHGREKLYQYIDTEACFGVFHLICDSCSATHHLNKHVSELISGMALENFGFVVNTQKAVLYGLCETCSQIQERN